MMLSRVVLEMLNVEYYCDLDIPVKGQSRSLKVVPFVDCLWFPISVLL